MPVPRRCLSCGGHFNYRTSLFEHWNDCTNPVQPDYPETQQDRHAAELRGRLFVGSEHEQSVDCPCERCEGERRTVLVEVYPELLAFGLSPNTEVDL